MSTPSQGKCFLAVQAPSYRVAEQKLILTLEVFGLFRHDARMMAHAQNLEANGRIARHRHPEGYLALVISGGYWERGDRGRFRVSEGQVVFHEAFEAHSNEVSPAGARVRNMALPHGIRLDFVIGSLACTIQDSALSQLDTAGAAALVLESTIPAELPIADWPDQLAAQLQRASLNLSDWARDHQLSATMLCRQFKAAFGVTPSAFRLQAAARRAWRTCVSTEAPLANIAHDTGFADQSHMTRAVLQLTGHTPGVWRKSVQDRLPALT